MAGFGETNKSNKKNIHNSKQNYNEKKIIDQAIKYHYEGNILQASKLYKFLIEKGSNNNAIYTNYALILIHFKKLKEAEFFIRKGIDLNPKDSKAHINLGGILKNQKKLKEAEFFIRKGIDLNPKDSTAHYNLGILLKDLGKLQESELSYRTAIRIKPDYAEAYINLGNILRNDGKFKEAKLCSEKVMFLRSWSISGSYSFNYEV